MSRSYKKFPLYRDNLWGKSLKRGKQYANRKLRRLSKQQDLDIPNGSGYKRMCVDSWDLWEYKSLVTKEDTINEWVEDQYKIVNGVVRWRTKYNPTLEEAIIDWYKWYKRK